MNSTKLLWLLPVFAVLWFCAPAARTSPRTAPAPALRQVPFPAATFTVTITGAKQGAFKGDTLEANRRGKIAGLRFEYEVSVPHDAASGQPSGKRQHKPVVFTKEWGAATPQIMQALVTNENLTDVVFEFYRRSADGVEEVDHTITLKNASLADFKQYAATELHDGSTEKMQVEDVALVFQKIQFKDNRSGLIAEDSWNDNGR